ncbi:hypothetical protein ACT3S7_06175 [Corynebacterium sp. AOP34-AQ2-28]|uniref:hypothetical protein n=1 Tax=Corynebacterium sp. AOP34-AQ2-28 TaxID=3457689 RepID=UPI0040342801
MPDQTPVTDDRIAHQWESKHRNDGNVGLAAVARAIRAHVPAPPATLAAELRYRATLLYNGDPDGDSAAVINALADRVEAVEKARDKAQQDAVAAWEHAAQTDREHVRIMELREQDYVRVASERDEARTKVEEVEGHLSKSWRQRDAKDVELERLSREREQQEKALVEHGRLLAEARAAFDEVENRNLNLEADLRESHAEVERLTVSLNRQCTTVTPSVHNTDVLTASNDTLPDPAEVGSLTSGRTVRESRTVALPDPA